MITCGHCGTAMPTPTGRAARKRFCGVDCRKAAWRQRHRNDTVPLAVAAVAAVPGVPTAVPGVPTAVPGVPTAVPGVVTAFPDDVPTPGGQHLCPHCRQPLAVISVLVPAAAAHVNTPEVTHA